MYHGNHTVSKRPCLSGRPVPLRFSAGTGRKIAAPEHLLRAGDATLFRRYQDAAGGAVRYLTVAPEAPGVVVQNRDAVLAGTGVRAGSTLTTGQALKNLVHFTGESVERVLPLLTANPAKLIGLGGKGVTPGMDADLVVLDGALDVCSTYVAGQEIWRLSS